MFNLKTLVLCGLGFAAAAQAQAEVSLKLATSAPVNTPWQMQIDRMAADVAEASEGRVKIEVFYSSQLGSENDVIAQVARGRVDMGLFTLGSATLQAPELAVLDMPLFFDTQQQRGCVLDDHMVAPVTEAIDKKGLVFGGWFEVGNGYLTAKQAFPTPEALKGKKVGVTINAKNEALFTAYGASPIPTNIPEAGSNASTGLIDAYATVYSFYLPSGLNKIFDTVTEFRYSDGPAVVLISKRSWAKLSEADRAAIRAAFAKVPAAQIRQEIFDFEDKMRAVHEKAGGKIYRLSATELDAYRAPLPVVWDRLGNGQGPEAKAMYDAMVAAKTACGS